MPNSKTILADAFATILSKAPEGTVQHATLENVKSRIRAYYDLHGHAGADAVCGDITNQLKRHCFKTMTFDTHGDPITPVVVGHVIGIDLKAWLEANYDKGEWADYVPFAEVAKALRADLGNEKFELLYGNENKFLGRHMMYQGVDRYDQSIDGTQTKVLRNLKRKPTSAQIAEWVEQVLEAGEPLTLSEINQKLVQLGRPKISLGRLASIMVSVKRFERDEGRKYILAQPKDDLQNMLKELKQEADAGKPTTVPKVTDGTPETDDADGVIEIVTRVLDNGTDASTDDWSELVDRLEGDESKHATSVVLAEIIDAVGDIKRDTAELMRLAQRNNAILERVVTDADKLN